MNIASILSPYRNWIYDMHETIVIMDVCIEFRAIIII